MLPIDLSGKRVFIAGLADNNGYAWGIAKALHQAGAKIYLGIFPPVLGVFERLLKRQVVKEAARYEGGELTFEKYFPLDVSYDTMEEVPSDVRQNERYQNIGDFSIGGCAAALSTHLDETVRSLNVPIDILVNAVANGPEVRKRLSDTSRGGFRAAMDASAYPLIPFLRHFGPFLCPDAAVISLTYLAGDRVVSGYGGGMSSAKAALQDITRTLACENPRHRFYAISAGPLASRAASAIGGMDKVIQFYKGNTPRRKEMTAADVGNLAAFLASPMGESLNGSTVFADHGYHITGLPLGNSILGQTAT